MTEALWYLARGTGTVSLILLSIVVILGIGGRSGRAVFGLPRFAVTLVHRNASLLAVVFLAIHVITLLFDPYAQLNLVNIIVPFTSSYRPLWVGLGTAALDLVLAIVVTSLLRHRIGVRAWRAVHWFAYICWPIAIGHAIGSGTDARQAWLLVIVVVCGAGVLAALMWRMSTRFTEHSSSTTNLPLRTRSSSYEVDGQGRGSTSLPLRTRSSSYEVDGQGGGSTSLPLRTRSSSYEVDGQGGGSTSLPLRTRSSSYEVDGYIGMESAR